MQSQGGHNKTLQEEEKIITNNSFTGKREKKTKTLNEAMVTQFNIHYPILLKKKKNAVHNVVKQYNNEHAKQW